MASFKFNIFISILFLLLSCFLCIAYVDNCLGYTGDDIQVIHQAVAAIDNKINQFISDYSYMNSKNVDLVATNAYSWGTSFLLAPLYKFYGLNNIIAFKIVMILSYCFYVFIFSLYFLRKVSKEISIPIIFFFSTSPFFIMFSNDILKDLPYLFVSFLWFLSVEKFLGENNIKRKLIYSCIVSLLLFLCIIFRENGWSLLFVLFVCQVIKEVGRVKEKKERNLLIYFSYLMPYIFAIGTYFILSIKYPTYYQTSVFSLMPDSIISMIMYYFEQFRQEFFNCTDILSYFLSIWVVLLFIYGIIKSYKQEYVALVILATFVGYILCPVEQGVRYIIPLIPFIFIFIGLGISKIENLYLKRLNIFFLVIICILNLSILAQMNLHNRLVYKKSDYGIQNSMSLDLYKYIRENISNDKKIIYWHPRAIYFNTGRLSFQIGEEEERLKEGDYQVSIVGKDGPGSFYDKEMYNLIKKTYIQEANVYLVPIYRNKDYAVYEIEKEQVKN